MARTGDHLLPSGFPSFRHLRVFDAVARHENLSRAALEVNMSQPAVTQAVMKIENWVSVRLFQRSWTGTFLTPEGRIFHGRVRRLFEQVELALDDNLVREKPKDAVQTVMSRWKSAHINVLAAAAESTSFDDAARSLGLSRTTVQRTARELEHILACSLYERASDGLVVNAAARRLATALPRACRELPEGLEEIAALAGRMQSRLFIGAQRVVCSSLLASAVNSVLSLYPSTSVKIIEGSYRQLLHELRSGRIDLVFGALERPAGVIDVIEEPLFHAPYCVAGRRDHPLMSRKRIGLAGLAQLGWVLPAGESQRSRSFEQMFSNAEQRPTSCITVSAISTQIAILSTSDRVTLLPRHDLLLEPQFSMLAELPAEVQIQRVADGLTMRAGWVPSQIQSFFRDELKQRINDLGLCPAASGTPTDHDRASDPSVSSGGSGSFSDFDHAFNKRGEHHVGAR
jgi:LysR family transcriptional regulator, regulator for genes of the gallate degradation pathway